MAKQLSYIIIESFQSDGDGDLVTTGHKIRYTVKDSVDPELRKGGELEMDEIDDSDTVAVWWGKIRQQIADTEGIV